MAVIKSGSSPTQLDVDAPSNAARVTLYDTTGLEMLPSGPHFYVSGATSAVVAASLAVGSTLVSLRNGAASTLHITALSLTVAPSTVGTSGLVPGVIAWQRFTTATPSGGTVRSVNRKDLTSPLSNVVDVRDSNAALTVTGVVFTDVLTHMIVPVFTSGGGFGYRFTFDSNDPLIIPVNGGLCLRTQTAMPGTQTWSFAYQIEWLER